MGGRRTFAGTFLSLLLVLLALGCDAGNGSGERIQLVITPVPTPTNTAPPLPTVGATKYTVQSGDTLSGIASRFGISVDDIVRANNIADPNSLSEGQVLTIPPREVAPPTAVVGISVTPVITGTLVPGPTATETLPPLDATPPQGPIIPDETAEVPSTPGITNSPTVGP